MQGSHSQTAVSKIVMYVSHTELHEFLWRAEKFVLQVVPPAMTGAKYVGHQKHFKNPESCKFHPISNSS